LATNKNNPIIPAWSLGNKKRHRHLMRHSPNVFEIGLHLSKTFFLVQILANANNPSRLA